MSEEFHPDNNNAEIDTKLATFDNNQPYEILSDDDDDDDSSISMALSSMPDPVVIFGKMTKKCETTLKINCIFFTFFLCFLISSTLIFIMYVNICAHMGYFGQYVIAMSVYLTLSYGITTASAFICWRKTVKGKNGGKTNSQVTSEEDCSSVNVLQMGEFISKVQFLDKILEDSVATSRREKEEDDHIANPQDLIDMQEAIQKFLSLLRPIFKSNENTEKHKLKKARNIATLILATIHCLPLFVCGLFWLRIETIDVEGKNNCAVPFTYYWTTVFIIFCFSMIQIWSLFVKICLKHYLKNDRRKKRT